MLHRICSTRLCPPSCLHVSTRPNSYVRFDWLVIFRVRFENQNILCNPDPKNNRPIKSHVGIRPRTLICKHDGRHYQRLQILWNIALKLQIGKDDDKKESKCQKYIHYASNGYQYYGESGQDTNTQLFKKSVVWKFDIWDSSLVVFRVVEQW